MTNYLLVLGKEIEVIRHLLSSIPFRENDEPEEYFVNTYKLSYNDVKYLNEEPNMFPIESSKLLKLGISLGNLVKSFQVDEEIYRQQHQQHSLQNSMESLKLNNNTTTKPKDYNPFNDQGLYVISTSLLQQASYQIKFIKSLLNIIKNFDIGNNIKQENTQTGFQGLRRQDSISSDNSSSMSRPSRNFNVNSNASPIKLSSKQLLIEKLEINIQLDALFIYKMVFTLLEKVLKILHTTLIDNGAGEVNQKNIPNEENSSIFSSASASSSESVITIDEYYGYLKSSLDRIIIGINKPFMDLILLEVLEKNVTHSFNNLINSL